MKKYKNIVITQELNQARKCIIYNFHGTIPVSRIVKTLSIIDEVVLKHNDKDFEIIIEKIHDLQENILYLLPFEKVIREEQEAVEAFS